MKVAINCLSINSASALGVRTFLLAHLHQLPAFSRSLSYNIKLVFFVQDQSSLKSDIESALCCISPRISVHIVVVSGIDRATLRVLYEQCVLPFFMLGFDTVYSINNANPLFKLWGTRSIVTIHDLLPFKASARYGPHQQAYLRLFTKMCACRATRVITVSNFTKKEVGKLLDVDPIKISVIYNCLPLPFSEGVLSADRYLLVVGGLNSDKRVDLTLRGFGKFLKRNPNCQLRLVIAGPDQGARHQLEELVSELGLSQIVSFLGMISESNKNELLSGCLAIVMMGRSEGFGIPVLEAMRFGKPSLVADSGALPEIVGKAGFVVRNPENAEQVADGINSLTQSKTDWITICRDEYAKFRIEDSSRVFWSEVLMQPHYIGTVDGV